MVDICTGFGNLQQGPMGRTNRFSHNRREMRFDFRFHQIQAIIDKLTSGIFRFLSWGDMILFSIPSFKVRDLKLGS